MMLEWDVRRVFQRQPMGERMRNTFVYGHGIREGHIALAFEIKDLEGTVV